MDRSEAEAALASIGGARAQLAEVADCPPWRHAVFGLIMGMLTLAVGIGGAMQMGLTVLALGLIAATVASDRRRMGLFVNGYRRGRTLPVAAGLLVGMLAIMFLQIHLRQVGAALSLRVAVAAGAFLVAVAGSIVWQRRFRAEMLRQDA